jgi:signal transduction histidine kinase
VQEALTNCVRHASAATIRVMLKRLDEGLVVAVVDDGIGMLDTGRHNGLGLRGIEERVRDLGGTFDIHSAPGVGTSLTVRLPLTRIIPQGEVGVASVIG